MRILMSALHPEGGIRTFFRYIYGHPVFSTNSFTLVAPDRELGLYLAEFLPDRRIQLVPAQSGKIHFMRQIRTLANQDRFDLIHSHGFSAGSLTELARSGLAVPHLMTAHDVFLPVQFERVSGQLRHWGMAQIFRRMTAIHTVTDDARQNLLDFFPGIPPSRVHGILHGVDTLHFRDAIPAPLKEKIGLPDAVPLIGFFGRFMGQKGFRMLVDAMDRIVHDKILPVPPHVVTFGWNGFIREDYEYLKGKGLSDYFHQHEQTHDIAGMLKAVDLVAMPSRWEACGLLAMEALAAGVPIVGSDSIGLREVLAGSPATPFRTGDTAALLAAIVSELRQIAERKSAFIKYQPEAVTRFDIERPAQSLAALYSELAKARSH